MKNFATVTATTDVLSVLNVVQAREFTSTGTTLPVDVVVPCDAADAVVFSWYNTASNTFNSHFFSFSEFEPIPGGLNVPTGFAKVLAAFQIDDDANENKLRPQFKRKYASKMGSAWMQIKIGDLLAGSVPKDMSIKAELRDVRDYSSTDVNAKKKVKIAVVA